MPLRSRIDVFLRWMGEQDPSATYRYQDHCGCALGAFARAIFRSEDARGGANTIHPCPQKTYDSDTPDAIVILPDDDRDDQALMVRSALHQRNDEPRSYGGALAALKRELAIWEDSTT